jgi:uncharacterized protein YraI
MLLLVSTILPAHAAWIPQKDLEPQPNGEILLLDDFTDPTQSAQAAYDTDWMSWSVSDGIGHLSSNAADKEVAAEYSAVRAADLYLEVDLRIPAPGAEGAGLLLRGSDLRTPNGQEWHYYHVRIQPESREVQFGLLTEGSQDLETLESCRLPPSLSDFTHFRRLRVEALGPRFRIFVDAQYVCEWTDSTLADPGQIGVVLGVAADLASKEQAVAEFADLRLYSPAATSPEPGREGGEPLPEEEFSVASGRWQTGSDDNGEVRVENGLLLVRNLTAAPYRTETHAATTASDVVVEAETWLNSGTDDNWHSFFCRNDGAGTFFSASLSTDGYYGAWLSVGGETQREQQPTRSDIVRQGEHNRARLVCVGKQLQFWVNEVLLIDWEESTLPAGTFGFAAAALDGEYTELAFANIAVTLGAAQPTGGSQLLEAVVVAPSLHVRAGPGSSYPSVGVASAGDRLVVVDADTACSWIRVVTSTTLGWVSTRYVTLTGPCSTVQTSTVQSSTVQSSTVQSSTVQSSTVQSSTVQTSPAPAAAPLIADFEAFGTWRRGDETWGEFRQSSQEVYAGSYAGALTYDFPANVPGDRNYVVFRRTLPIAGQPTELEIAVFGDGSENFLNVWVQDASGQIWQFSFGQISHLGWKRMVAPLDPSLEWPVQPVGGNATTLQFPISFYALVLDCPTATAASGTLYLDELRALYPE